MSTKENEEQTKEIEGEREIECEISETHEKRINKNYACCFDVAEIIII